MTGFFDESSSGAPLDLPAFFDSAIPEMLWGIVAAGALVGVSTSRDSSVVSLSVTHNGRTRRAWFRDADEATMFLGRALEAVQGHPPAPTASRARRGR